MFCTVNADNCNMFPFLVISGLFLSLACCSWLFNSLLILYVTFALRDSTRGAWQRNSYLALLLLLKSNELSDCQAQSRLALREMWRNSYCAPPYSWPFCFPPNGGEMQFTTFYKSTGMFNFRCNPALGLYNRPILTKSPLWFSRDCYSFFVCLWHFTATTWPQNSPCCLLIS